MSTYFGDYWNQPSASGQDYSQMGSWGQPPVQGPQVNVGTPVMPNPAVPVAPGAPPSIWDNFLGSTKNGVQTPGWGGTALGAASGLFNAWLGMKQYGVAKDSLAEGKRQFGLNFDAQRATTNSALEDRQRARVASNPGAYQSVGDYIAANGIRG